MAYKQRKMGILQPLKELVCREYTFLPIPAQVNEAFHKRFDRLHEEKRTTNDKHIK